jgi:hypothetical protein
MTSAHDRDGLVERASARKSGTGGPYRLAIVGANREELEQRCDRALLQLREESDSFDAGTYFRSEPLRGSVALVFPTVGRTYPGVGKGIRTLAPGLIYEPLKSLTAELDDPNFAGRSWAEWQGVATFVWGNFATRIVRQGLGVKVQQYGPTRLSSCAI